MAPYGKAAGHGTDLGAVLAVLGAAARLDGEERALLHLPRVPKHAVYLFGYFKIGFLFLKD